MAPGHTVPGATTRTRVYIILKTKHRYKYKCNNLCRNTQTPSVTATGFFAGEVEICDFVTERVKRRIAA